MKYETFASIVLTIDSYDAQFEAQMDRLSTYLSEHFNDHEIIIVKNLDRRRAGQDPIENRILSRIRSVRLLQMAQVCDYQTLVYAGLENSIGDIVILFDMWNDPLEVISSLVDQILGGCDVMVGCDRRISTFVYRIVRGLFRPVFENLLNYRIPKNSTNLRALSRRAVNDLLKINRHPVNIVYDISRLEYKSGIYHYSQLKRARQKKLSYGIQNIVSILVYDSTKLLRLANIVGLLGSLMGVFMSLYAVLFNLLIHRAVEGWTSMSLFLSVSFCVLFFVLFVLGEYIVRVVEDKDKLGVYTIMHERNSSVMLDLKRLNVMDESLPTEINRTKTGRDR